MTFVIPNNQEQSDGESTRSDHHGRAAQPLGRFYSKETQNAQNAQKTQKTTTAFAVSESLLCVQRVLIL